MFWDRRNDSELPEELRGKKPEEIAAALRKAKELEDQIKAEADAKKALEDKLAAQTTEFDTIKQKLADVEAKLTPAPVNNDEEDEPASPWTDPQKFVQDATKPVADVALNAGLMASKMYFMQNLTGRDQKIFKKFEKEIDTIHGTFAPQTRVMPQSWMNAFIYVKGLHDTEIAKAERESTDFFSEVPSRGAPGHRDEESEVKLTAEEEETCRVMRWDPKGYLERKKSAAMFGSGKGQYANFKVPTTK